MKSANIEKTNGDIKKLYWTIELVADMMAALCESVSAGSPV